MTWAGAPARQAAVASSYFYFYREKGLTGEATLDEWARHWADHGTWCEALWPYVVDNWLRRHDPSVLIIIFVRARTDLELERTSNLPPAAAGRLQHTP
jgi:hypothetical protein